MTWHLLPHCAFRNYVLDLLDAAGIDDVKLCACAIAAQVYVLCSPVQISEKPLAYIWKNFISSAEAKHIVQIAAPRLRQSLFGTDPKPDVRVQELTCHGDCWLQHVG